jgi:6-pyruvoyltetrahydropterin/6-carboxytetrahydropterin synthase
MGQHRLQIISEEHRFSAAHMAVYPDGSKDRLHGHSFQLTLRMAVRLGPQEVCDARIVRRVVQELCSELNERVLVALNSPHLRVTVESVSEDTSPSRESIRLWHQSGEYMLPRADVLLLPLPNTTPDQLARWAHGELCRRLRGRLPLAIEELSVGVLETPGQGASYEGPPEVQ